MAAVLDVEQSRLVHMADPHLAALRTVISAREWSGLIEVESGRGAADAEHSTVGTDQPPRHR